MEVLEGLRGRRAVRDYLDEPVSRDLIGAVIESAVWAPSGMNRQPWRFLILEGRDVLARCSAAAKRPWGLRAPPRATCARWRARPS